MKNTSILSERTFGNVKVIENRNYDWCVTDLEGNEIVPFGKYDWIDGFDHGLARVKIGKVSNGIKNSGNKWGIINEQGEEVLPVEYDNIWNFLGKNRDSTTVEKGETSSLVRFCDLNPELQDDSDYNHYSHSHNYDNYDYDRYDWREDTWDAMTDGMYGDMPSGYDSDYDWLG